jgi:hypothetical protein
MVDESIITVSVKPATFVNVQDGCTRPVQSSRTALETLRFSVTTEADAGCAKAPSNAATVAAVFKQVKDFTKDLQVEPPHPSRIHSDRGGMKNYEQESGRLRKSLIALGYAKRLQLWAGFL